MNQSRQIIPVNVVVRLSSVFIKLTAVECLIVFTYNLVNQKDRESTESDYLF